MGLKSDLWIKEMSKKGMIEPFCEKQVGQNIVSYGLSSYGYDIRVGSEFMIFTNIGATLVDPKSFESDFKPMITCPSKIPKNYSKNKSHSLSKCEKSSKI